MFSFEDSALFLLGLAFALLGVGVGFDGSNDSNDVRIDRLMPGFIGRLWLAGWIWA